MEIFLWNVLEWGLYGLVIVFGLVLVFAVWTLCRILFEAGRDAWRALQTWLLRRRAASWWRS
jgi:hypothetical protein